MAVSQANKKRAQQLENIRKRATTKSSRELELEVNHLCDCQDLFFYLDRDFLNMNKILD